jgi:hypothetical protein
LVDTTPLLKENQALYATQWSRLLADQLTVQRDGAVKNYLREFEMLSNLTALLINNPSKELAVLRETSLRQYQVILDNLMTDSYIDEKHDAEVTIFLYQAASLGQATGDESLMVHRVEQIMKLAAEPRNQKQPEATFDLLAIQMLARHYEGKSNTLAGVEVWGLAWRWISRLDADLIKKHARPECRGCQYCRKKSGRPEKARIERQI